MRITGITGLGAAILVAIGTGACSSRPPPYTGPGCRIQLYTLPNLQGLAVPVITDTPELAESWRAVSSARVIYGTWRLFADPDFKGFMGDYAAPSDVLLLEPTKHLGSLQCIKPAPAPVPLY